MTALDVRTAAHEEALGRWPRQDVSVMHDADLSNYLCRHGFEEGAVWGAALASEGIRLTDFRGDGVYRDADGVIWQRVEDTRKAV